MKKSIREIFSSGASGRLSSKRVMGAAALVFAFVLTGVVVWLDRSADVLIYPYALSGGLLGGGVLDGLGSKIHEAVSRKVRRPRDDGIQYGYTEEAQ